MKKLRVVLIGVGARGEGLYRVDLKKRTNVEYVAVCDNYMDRCESLPRIFGSRNERLDRRSE